VSGQFRVVWHPRHYEVAVGFYRDTLGLPLVGGWDRGEDDRGALLGAASGIVELLKLPEGQEYVAPAGVSLLVEVDDVDAFHAQLTAHGLKAPAPEDRPWGARQFSVQDPDGVTVTLFSPV
jgi:catechol 2,3-dioxygenase-like lactoylglutathione lyase family enzyme